MSIIAGRQIMLEIGLNSTKFLKKAGFVQLREEILNSARRVLRTVKLYVFKGDYEKMIKKAGINLVVNLLNSIKCGVFVS